MDLDRTCEDIMDDCVASEVDASGVGCDNMTMMIVGFLQGSTKEHWYAKVSNRVPNMHEPCASTGCGMHVPNSKIPDTMFRGIHIILILFLFNRRHPRFRVIWR